MSTLEPDHQALIIVQQLRGVSAIEKKRWLEPKPKAPTDLLDQPKLSRLCRYQNLNRSWAQQVIDQTEKAGGYTVGYHDLDYPAQLRELADPPYLLFCKGERALLSHRPVVAMVGSRKASSYGTRMAEWFATELAGVGCLVCSGMASGIDGAAQRAALAGHGVSIGVLGHGIDQIYPRCNQALFQEMSSATGGLLLSEYPPGTPPRPGNFPRRNRIISGLCDALLVVEAGPRSGSLISARLANEEGRVVYCVPHPLTMQTRQAGNNLIREGATLVTQPADIIEELGVRGAQSLSVACKDHNNNGMEAGSLAPELSSLGKRVLSVLAAEGAVGVERLAQLTEAALPALLSVVGGLELEGRICVHRDGRYGIRGCAQTSTTIEEG